MDEELQCSECLKEIGEEEAALFDGYCEDCYEEINKEEEE